MRRLFSTLAARGEMLNVLTHAIGVALAIAALSVLVTLAARHSDGWRVVSCSVFGATLVLAYLASTLFHFFGSPRTDGLFHALDQIAIYLLIAGTYTPFALVSLRGPWGWTLFGLIWGFAVAGILLRVFLPDRIKAPSYVIYLAMGWLVLIALKPVIEAISPAGIWWLLAGGLSYSVGVVFLLWHRLPHHHALWHLFVLGGSACHFFAVLLLL